jgi:O-antigen/teichoic acid export membrane protein
VNFLGKYIFSIFGKFLGAFLALLSSIMLARFLGPTGVGQYQLITTTKVILVSLFAMGFGNASIFFINQKKIDEKLVITNLFKFFSLISVLVFVLVFLALKLFDTYFGSLNNITIILVSIAASFLLIYSVLVQTLYASLQVVKIQIVSLASTFFLLIGLGVFYIFGSLNVELSLIISSLGTIMATLILLFLLKNKIDIKIKINFKLLNGIFNYGILLSATNLAYLLSINIVTFLLKNLNNGSFSSIGLFSRASAISNMFIMIPMTIGPLLYSKLSSVNNKEILKMMVERTLRIIISISFISTLFIFFLGENLLLLFYGKDFLGATESLNILAFSLTFSSITVVLTNVFSSIGKPLNTFISYSLSLLITVICAIIMIPKFGIEGAAISVLIGLIYNSIHLFYFSKAYTGIRISKSLIVIKSDLVYLKQVIYVKR